MSCTFKPSECGSRTSGSTVFTMPKNLPKMTKLQQHDTKYSSFWQSCVSFPGLVPAFVPTFCSLGASMGPWSRAIHASIVCRVPPIPSAARLHGPPPPKASPEGSPPHTHTKTPNIAPNIDEFGRTFGRLSAENSYLV